MYVLSIYYVPGTFVIYQGFNPNKRPALVEFTFQWRDRHQPAQQTSKWFNVLTGAMGKKKKQPIRVRGNC